MFTQLKDIVPITVNKLGLKRQFDAAYICQLYRKHVPVVMNDGKRGEGECLHFASPKSFKNGTLYISVVNSFWAQKVFMYRKKIIEKINEDFGMNVVKDVRTEIK